MNGTPTDAVIVEVEAVIAPKGSVQPTVKKQEVAAPQDVQPTVPIGSLWQSVLRDTVRSAIGLVAAEVWLFETDGTASTRPTHPACSCCADAHDGSARRMHRINASRGRRLLRRPDLRGRR